VVPKIILSTIRKIVRQSILKQMYVCDRSYLTIF